MDTGNTITHNGSTTGGVRIERVPWYPRINAENDRPPRFQFIINPSAGHCKYKQIVRTIEESLSDPGLKYDIRVLQYRGEAISAAREAANDHDVVVAVGGDGTVNEVFNGIIGTDAIFGVIPAGTGNGFAREFGLPLYPDKACKVLAEGYIREIDVGKVNDRYFLGTAGVGFDALIAKAASKKYGPLRGMWLYFFAGAFIFFRFKRQLITVEIDSQTVEVKPLLVAVANTRIYGGSALIAPDAEPDDGQFDICVIHNMKAIRLLWNLPKLFTGKHIHLPDVNIYRGENISIHSPRPLPAHVDGEPIDDCPDIKLTLLPKAIRILVPGDCSPV